MLLSSVIHIEALDNGAIPQYIAPALRAEFLNWIGETDKGHAGFLHDGNELRPYTISDLKGTFRAQRGLHLLEAKQKAWFRITSLNEEQTRLLQGQLFPKVIGQEFSLNKVRFRVLSVAEKHPWAGASSYAALVEKYFNADISFANGFEMEFASPTAFRLGDVDSALPIPQTTALSWLKRWNKFSSANLPQVVDEIKAARLVLNRYSISTSPLQYKEATWIGFTGKCYYRILARDEFWVRLCHLLAEYAFYCGTGKKTSFGLGQTKKT